MLIAIGNSGDPAFLPAVERRLGDDSPLVRGAAVWALRRLDAGRAQTLSLAFLPAERDETVRGEWTGEAA